MNEADIMRQIQRELSIGTVRLFRNNSGALPDRNGRLVHFGVGGVGGSDLIGISLQANGMGRLVAIEVKAPTKRTTQAQQDYIDLIRKLGGQAGVAHNLEEAVEILRQP